MNSELTNIKNYFTERRLRCLSVSAIEKEAKVPSKTLSHFLKGRRMMNLEHLERIVPVLVDFGYIPFDEQFL
jgi:predicted transcriptional regulator